MGFFGRKKEQVDQIRAILSDDMTPTPKEGVDATVLNIIKEYREQWTKLPISKSVELYFQSMNQMKALEKENDYKGMASVGMGAFQWIEPFIIHDRVNKFLHDNFEGFLRVHGEYPSGNDWAYEELIERYGCRIWGDSEIPECTPLQVKSLPIITDTIRYDAIMGHAGGVKNIVGFVEYFPELKRTIGDTVADEIHSMTIAKMIRKHIKENPGAIQSRLAKELTGIPDGRKASNICSWMEKFGLLRREKNGKSYELYLTY